MQNFNPATNLDTSDLEMQIIFNISTDITPILPINTIKIDSFITDNVSAKCYFN